MKRVPIHIKFLILTVLVVAGGFLYSSRIKNKPAHSAAEGLPNYEHSLMVNGKKIKNFRSPSALSKWFKETVEGKKKFTEETATVADTKDENEEPRGRPGVKITQGSYGGSSSPSYTPAASPTPRPSTTPSAPVKNKGASGSSTMAAGYTAYNVVPPTTSNPPSDNTTAGASSGSSSTTKTPFLKGKISPLNGLIASHSSFFAEAYANLCDSPRILLMDLMNYSILLDNPISAKDLSSNTAFSFDPQSLKLNINYPNRYLLRTYGCQINYERIISSFYEDQDLTAVTTLVSKIINTRQSNIVSQMDAKAMNNLYKELNTSMGSEIDFMTIFNRIDSTPNLKQVYTSTFSGSVPVELKEAAPDINGITVHKSINEKSTYHYSVSPFHWDPNYDIGVEWQINGVVQSNSFDWAYTPSANSPARIAISLILGNKNALDNDVDRSKPYHQVDFEVFVNDLFPSTAPSFALSSANPNPVSNRNIVLDISTGLLANGVYSGCETFSEFAITEGNQIPGSSDFIHSCSNGPADTLNYTILTPGDGSIPLKIWARDIEGRVSIFPTVVVATVDTSYPIIEFQNILANYTAEETITFQWNLTELSSSASQFFDVEFYDGSSWITLPQVPLTDGPHSPTTFSTSYALPNINTSGNKLRVTYTDLTGLQTIEESPTFNVRSPILTSNPLVVDFGTVPNKTTSTPVTILLTNSGLVPSQICGPVMIGGPQASEFTVYDNQCIGSVVPAGGSCALSFVTAPQAKGLREGTFSISCGSSSYSSTLSVISSNNPPTVAASLQTLNEDTPTTINLGPIVDTDGDSLTYSIVTPPSHGTVTGCAIVGSEYHCTYTPSLNYHGADSFTFKANDGISDSNVGTFPFNVLPVNDAPTLAATQAVSGDEDTPTTFMLNPGNDVDGDPLTFIIETLPASGSLTCDTTTGECTYTPVADFNGTVTFTYKVTDSLLESSVATVTLTISDINDPPVMGADQSLSTNEDTALAFTLNPATDIDVPAQTLSYKLVTSPTKGTLTGCIDLSSYVTSRNCTYTPHPNETGTDTFTYRAYDSISDSLTVATVTITIVPVNDAPVLAGPQSITTPEDQSITFDVNAATDVENDPLTYIVVSSPSHGTLSCVGGASRSCTYTPSLNYNGADSFTYKANDGLADSNTITVNITVTPVNDPPVMGANQSFTTPDNTPLSITLNIATDVDGDALTYRIVTPPSNGTLSNCITTGSYGTDLTCTYQANTNFNGTDTFTYVAYDSTIEALIPATVTITVNDTTPSPAPNIILASDLYTNSTATTYTALSCSDTPYIFFNEGSAPLAGDSGWQPCTLTAGALSYTLTTSQGTHTVKAWSKDAYGNVSTSATDVTVYYDTVLPVLSLTTPGAQRGGDTISFAWTATEAYSSSSLYFTVEFFDGSTWTSAGTTAATTGALSNSPFTRTYTLPYVNTSAAAFRVAFTDRAGNYNQVASGNFTIDSTPPALAINTPADNSYHLSSAIITGTCETGRNITFSGDLQSTFSIACSSGTFSQLVNFSNGDGTKIVSLTQTDAVGNSTTVSRTLIRDEVAPVLTKTTGQSPFFTRYDTPNTWGGTCEGNYTITVTGAENTTFNCSSGSWSWTPSPKYTDGTFSYNLVQTDAAGNTSSPPLNLSWQRDATPPSFALTTPYSATSGQTISVTNNFSSFMVTGNCEGINSINISGDAADNISCSSGSFQWPTPTYGTDGTRTFVLTQYDTAGNSSSITLTWTRNTQGPVLGIASYLLKTNTNQVTFTGQCHPGYDVVVTGVESATFPCGGGSWTYTTQSYGWDDTRDYYFTQTFTDPPYNATTVNGKWIRETDRPVVTSFTTSSPDPTRSSYIKVNVLGNSQNPQVYVSHVCFRSDNNSEPDPNNSCFIPVTSPDIGLAPAQTLNLTNYSTIVGWTPKNYDIYAWVRDEAGNVSGLTQVLNVDRLNITYDPGVAPTIWNVSAANISNAPIPPTRPQSEVPAGTDVFIRWNATDNYPLPSGAISLYYTTDEINFNLIASGLDNADYGCGEALASDQGCYRWTGGSPLDTSYKIRVRVTDSTLISSQLISNPLNLGLIRIIAGNTESGLGGSAQTAMFITRRQDDFPDVGTLVVSKDGTIYFADFKRGILTVDQNDGKQKIFIQATGVSSGDGGPAVNATLDFPHKITLDYQNRLLIWDQNRIRRVDLNSANPTIETIIGGGMNTADTVANPLDLQMNHNNKWDTYEKSSLFFAMPNGDIYFNSERGMKEYWESSYRIRIYKAATNQIISKYVSGYGDQWHPSQDIMKCRLINPGLEFDPSNSKLTNVTINVWYEWDSPGCSYSGNLTRTFLDPETFVVYTKPYWDDAYRWTNQMNTTGMDGKMYVIPYRSGIIRMNFDGSYTWILGNGTKGECVDGTPATSCYADVQNVFVTTTGKFYFTDRGMIRTIDTNGNVKTLFGQKLNYGTGVNALNARFSDLNHVYQLANGKIIVNDRAGEYVKEFTTEGNINVIAGDGISRNPTVGASASTTSLRWAEALAVNKNNGDVYTWYVESGYGSYVKLNRATGLWEHVIGNPSGGTHYTSGDGLPGLDIDAVVNEQTRSYPLTFDNDKLVTNIMRNNGTRWTDYMLKTYDANDVYRQSHLAGKFGISFNPTNERQLCDIIYPIPATDCEMPHWDTIRDMQWDPVGGRWIGAAVWGWEREIFELYPGGHIKRIFYTQYDINESFLYLRQSGQEFLYYCNGSRIRQVNLTTQTEIGDLQWSMPTLSCKGFKMSYNAANNSIIFPFEQNGLNGVAEYFLP